MARPAQEVSSVPDLATAAFTDGCGRAAWERILRFLAEGLQARGKLEAEEAFIGASFTWQKGGPRAAKDRKSSLWRMITVFLSQSVSKALRRTKANLSKASSGTASSTASPDP
jgi:hypothetical protein